MCIKCRKTQVGATPYRGKRKRLDIIWHLLFWALIALIVGTAVLLWGAWNYI